MATRQGRSLHSQTTNDFSIEDIKAALLPDIENVIKSNIESTMSTIIGERLDRIDAKINQLATLQQSVVDLRTAVQDTSDRMEDLLKVTLPSLVKQCEDITTTLVMQQLDQEVHRRKWAITIQGLPGEAREDESDTRNACIALAKDHLGINDANERDFAACHRLQQDKDAGIIARFVDLQKRDQWLLGARRLKNSDLRVSLSPDLPPVLRPLKKELLEKRRELPPEVKSRAHVRYLRQWPYVELSMGKNKTSIRPSTTQRAIVQKFLGSTPLSVSLNFGETKLL